MRAGEKITVPPFVFKGKLIDDPFVRLGEVMTEIESANKEIRYFKVKLYRSEDDGYRHVIIRKDKDGTTTIPEFKIKRRRKVKSQRLPIFGDN